MVPAPAPANISPVAFSSTVRSITLFSYLSLVILYFTDLKIFFALIFSTDFLNRTSLKGSPSSIINAFLKTFSSVIKFPNMFILSTYCFLISSKFTIIFILFSGNSFSLKLALINTKSLTVYNH